MHPEVYDRRWNDAASAVNNGHNAYQQRNDVHCGAHNDACVHGGALFVLLHEDTQRCNMLKESAWPPELLAGLKHDACDEYTRNCTIVGGMTRRVQSMTATMHISSVTTFNVELTITQMSMVELHCFCYK